MTNVLQYIFSEVKNKRLQKSHAIDLIRQFQTQVAVDKPRFIHPLMQENISSLFEQRYSSSFTGHEFFLADHVVKGERVMPGVAYLEMARAAVAQAAEIMEDGQRGIQLKNVVWARPIVVGKEGAQVRIGLFPEDDGRIAYEIYSEPDGDGDPVVHSQGRALLSFQGGNGKPHANEAPTLDLAVLQAECNQNSLSSAQCYETFRAMGMEYGPGHRGIKEIYIGRGQVLAKLFLPTCIADTQEQYVLHPSLMDSTLQASVGLMNGTGDGKAALPFALEELEILGRCSANMWALIKYSHGSSTVDRVRTLDIDLCDEAGRICVRMKGLTFRVLEGGVGSVGASAAIETGMFKPCWKEQIIREESPIPAYTKHLVMLCELDDISQEDIGSEMKEAKCLTLKSQQAEIDKRFLSYASQAFEEIQGILKEKPRDPVLIQIVVPTRDEGQLFSGLSGLLKTAQMENPKILGQVIEVDAGENADGIVEKLKENSRSPLDNRIRYQDGKRWVASWSNIFREKVGMPWKAEGVYLITGGAGGLGFIFAKEIARQAKNATVILTGRSALTEAKQVQR